MQQIALQPRVLGAYAELVDRTLLDNIQSLARGLRDLRVLHINSTAEGGGVAEILRSLVPLEQDCGLNAEWQVVRGAPEFYGVTKRLHNALQGNPSHLDGHDTYLQHNQEFATALDGKGYDVIIVHDPQPAAMRSFAHTNGAKWIWRCHIDTSTPNLAAWELLHPHVGAYDATIFTLEQFALPSLDRPSAFIAPAIDPFVPKNRALAYEAARSVLAGLGIDPARPVMSQVSRFDPWKDPWGVVDAFRLVREDVPGLQLALVGAMDASDDPEAPGVLASVREHVGGDPDIHLFSDPEIIRALQVNAFQSGSDVVVQKSSREGFGLVVTEAMWKNTPVVATRAGGIPSQIEDGISGLLIENTEECAERVEFLLTHPDEAGEIAAQGRRRVRERFLLPRLLRDELRLIKSLAG